MWPDLTHLQVAWLLLSKPMNTRYFRMPQKIIKCLGDFIKGLPQVGQWRCWSRQWNHQKGSFESKTILHENRKNTIYLGSTKVLTLFQPFYPRNVPKRVIGLSSGIKMLFFIPLHTIFVFFQDFLIEIAEIKCNHSLFC